MIYLRKYKTFERQTTTHIEIFDILQELFDKFGYQMPNFVLKGTSTNTLEVYGKLGRINVEDYYFFDAKCIRIRITAAPNINLIHPGVFKNFDGISYNGFSEILQECHERIIEYLNPVDVIVGSLGFSTIDLDMLYFFERPNFKRYKGVEIYGSNVGIYLDKSNLLLISNSRHDNIVDIYMNNSLMNMFCISGYGNNKYFYITDEDWLFLNHRKVGNPIQDWVVSEWRKICNKLKIRNFQKINIDNPKIIVPEFMAILAKNQISFTSKK
jgi:hypothetical protein